MGGGRLFLVQSCVAGYLKKVHNIPGKSVFKGVFMVELNEKQLMKIDGGRGQHEVHVKIWTPFVRVSYKFTGNNSKKRPGRNYTRRLDGGNEHGHHHRRYR